MSNSKFTVRIETWNTRKGRVGKVVIRNGNGTLHGATNFRQAAKVGQVARSRRG